MRCYDDFGYGEKAGNVGLREKGFRGERMFKD